MSQSGSRQLEAPLRHSHHSGHSGCVASKGVCERRCNVHLGKEAVTFTSRHWLTTAAVVAAHLLLCAPACQRVGPVPPEGAAAMSSARLCGRACWCSPHHPPRLADLTLMRTDTRVLDFHSAAAVLDMGCPTQPIHDRNDNIAQGTGSQGRNASKRMAGSKAQRAGKMGTKQGASLNHRTQTPTQKLAARGGSH